MTLTIADAVCVVSKVYRAETTAVPSATPVTTPDSFTVAMFRCAVRHSIWFCNAAGAFVVSGNVAPTVSASWLGVMASGVAPLAFVPVESDVVELPPIPAVVGMDRWSHAATANAAIPAATSIGIRMAVWTDMIRAVARDARRSRTERAQGVRIVIGSAAAAVPPPLPVQTTLSV